MNTVQLQSLYQRANNKEHKHVAENMWLTAWHSISEHHSRGTVTFRSAHISRPLQERTMEGRTTQLTLTVHPSTSHELSTPIEPSDPSIKFQGPWREKGALCDTINGENSSLDAYFYMSTAMWGARYLPEKVFRYKYCRAACHCAVT